MAATTTELWQLSATGLARAIRTRRVSSREVIEAHLRRIQTINPAVNAITLVLGDAAIDAATTADETTARGDELPSLHGVPFTVKGNLDLAGTPTTQGARALAEAYPERNAPTVDRLRAAGAIPIGRTNLPTFAVRWHCDSELHGATVNPWNPTRTPGASSGGEAVALATGMSPLGLGSDGLGSLRWPAQCCGICALKPTLGRLPHAGSLGPSDPPLGVQLTSVVGPMARRIADLRAAFEVLSGPSWRDPWSVPAPLLGPGSSGPRRVALVLDPGGLGIAPQVQRGLRRAAGALADGGYEVDELEPPSIALAASTLLDLLNTPEIRAGWQLIAAAMPAPTTRFMRSFYDVAGEVDPATAMQSFMVRATLLRAWSGFQETHPLILAPIGTNPPFEAGADLTTSEVASIIHDLRMAMAVNTLGLPAVALPVGIDDGLPQAVQLIGPRYREDLCLDAAETVEDRVGGFTPIDPETAPAAATATMRGSR
jgi:amidase